MNVNIWKCEKLCVKINAELFLLFLLYKKKLLFNVLDN